MSTLRAEPGWADLLVDYAPEGATAQKLVAQLRACQVSALAFCRLLERWARGEASPSTAGARAAALRRAAERAGSRRAGRVAAGAEPGRRAGVACQGCAGVPRAGSARSCTRGPRDGGPDAFG